MPYETRRAASALREDRAAESLHRLDIMRVEIGVLHVAVEPANVIAPRHKAGTHRFVVAIVARHQNDRLALFCRFFQRRDACAGRRILCHTLGEVARRIVFYKAAPHVVKAL